MTTETTQDAALTVTAAELAQALTELCIIPGDDGQDPANSAMMALTWIEKHREPSGSAPGPDPDPPLPDGIYARVEIAGYRDATGWVTEETRFGQQAAVVRDHGGRVTDVFILGPNSRMVALPTPMKRPDPPKAITAGSTWDDKDDDGDYSWGDDDDD